MRYLDFSARCPSWLAASCWLAGNGNPSLLQSRNRHGNVSLWKARGDLGARKSFTFYSMGDLYLAWIQPVMTVQTCLRALVRMPAFIHSAMTPNSHFRQIPISCCSLITTVINLKVNIFTQNTTSLKRLNINLHIYKYLNLTWLKQAASSLLVWIQADERLFHLYIFVSIDGTSIFSIFQYNIRFSYDTSCPHSDFQRMESLISKGIFYP